METFLFLWIFFILWTSFNKNQPTKIMIVTLCVASLLAPFPLLHLRGLRDLYGSGASTVCVCVCVYVCMVGGGGGVRGGWAGACVSMAARMCFVTFQI